MNARILKKLCKRAAPLLHLLGDTREQFRTNWREHGGGWGYARFDVKHIERWPRLMPDGSHRTLPNKSGYIRPFHGTVGIGATVGYEEPEWTDEPAYDALVHFVHGHFTQWEDWDQESDSYPTCSRKLHHPALVFAAAHDAIREIQESKQC